MADKEKYINVADVKRKLRYIFKAYGVGGFVREKVEVMIDNLPYSVKGNTTNGCDFTDDDCEDFSDETENC